MTLKSRRQEEYSKYEEAYSGVYGMGKARRLAAFDAIDRVEKGSFLDVGCGRGEVLEYAKSKGFSPVYGIDVVPLLFGEDVCFGEAQDIPFKECDILTCFDVIEHLLPEDTIPALKEFNRVAKKTVILSAANYPSYCNGEDLHINKREYAEWHRLIKDNIEGKVEWLPKFGRTHSETWIVSKP